ncbi:MAG: hypothetical protein AMJ54_06125 [Deltaproteobacteria bacterium SG8_13]|nr:MAG: hypothetical protein AMJ54_06125 [Deltaproteobacteria bacterium SG8_13]
MFSFDFYRQIWLISRPLSVNAGISQDGKALAGQLARAFQAPYPAGTSGSRNISPASSRSILVTEHSGGIEQIEDS